MARTNAEIEVRGQAVQQLEWNKRTDGPDMFVGPVYKTQPNQTHNFAEHPTHHLTNQSQPNPTHHHILVD